MTIYETKKNPHASGSGGDMEFIQKVKKGWSTENPFMGRMPATKSR